MIRGLHVAAHAAGAPHHRGGGGTLTSLLHSFVTGLGGLSALVGLNLKLLRGLPGRAAASIGASIFADSTGWVARGSSYLLVQVGARMSATTKPQIGTSYFSHELGVMAAAGAAVALPLLLLTAIQAVVQQDVGVLLRAIVVRIPLALLLTGVAVQLVSLGLAVTDSMSAAMLRAAAVPTGQLFDGLARGLIGSPTGPHVPAFAGCFVALGIAFAAIVLWLELALRSAALEVATLFLPLALAGVIWPATSHWARRLGETLAALVLSKLVVVSVLALAVGGLAGAGGGGFAGVVSGLALLLLAVFTPFALFRLVPAVEAGAIGHLEGLARRPARGAVSGAMAPLSRAIGSGSGAGDLAVAGANNTPNPVGTLRGAGFSEIRLEAGEGVARESELLAPPGSGVVSSGAGSGAGSPGTGGAGGGRAGGSPTGGHGGPGPEGVYDQDGTAGGGHQAETWPPAERRIAPLWVADAAHDGTPAAGPPAGTPAAPGAPGGASGAGSSWPGAAPAPPPGGRNPRSRGPGRAPRPLGGSPGPGDEGPADAG